MEIAPFVFRAGDLCEIRCRSCSCLWWVCAYRQWCVSLHSCDGARSGLFLRFGVGGGLGVTPPEPLPNSRCAEFNGVESLSDLIDGDPPESMRLGKQGSPSLLESQEAISGGGRMRAVCDVHAWTWGFRVMVCVYPGATPHKLRTSLSDPDTGPGAAHTGGACRVDSTSKLLICYHVGGKIRTHAMSR